MKLITTFTAALVVLLLRAQGSSAAPASNVGKGTFRCSSMDCPENSSSCQVNVRTDPKNPKQNIQTSECLSRDGKVLKQEVVKKSSASQDTGSAYAYAFGNAEGDGFSSEEGSHEFDEAHHGNHGDDYQYARSGGGGGGGGGGAGSGGYGYSWSYSSRTN